MHERINATLMSIARRTRLLTHCEPNNVEEQREAFMRGEELRFTYPALELDTGSAREELEALDIPVDELGRIFSRVRDALHQELRILEHRGEPGVVRDAAARLYGRPDEELLAAAKRILTTVQPEEQELVVSAARLRAHLEQTLKRFGLRDWRVELVEKHATTVDPVNKRITVARHRRFAENDLPRLAAHEVGVHALRAANGHAQPYSIFAYGPPDYMKTDEGLAVLAEEVTETQTPTGARALAGHVLAVDSVHRGDSFRETYEMLGEYFTSTEAWRLTVRSHRAGGFAKDHIYLGGELDVKRYLDNGGDLRLLYVGKVALADLPTVEALLEQGILHEPRFFPDFFD